MFLTTNSNFISIRSYSSQNHLTNPHPLFLPPKSLRKPTLNTPTTALIINLDKRCGCYDLHDKLVPYEKAWDWQKRVVSEKKKLIEMGGACTDNLIVLQHLPVYTMGTASSEGYLNFDIKNAPFDVFRTERGGEVTYHGPGQIVMYPIINLRNHKMDLHWYLRSLEEVVIRSLSTTFSIKASRVEGLTGVWVGDQKLAAVGIRVSQWITYHGLALNVSTDLTPFQWIVPCGIRNREVGSIRGVLGEAWERYGGEGYDGELIDITYKSLVNEFAEVFQLDVYQLPVSLSDICDKDKTNVKY